MLSIGPELTEKPWWSHSKSVYFQWSGIIWKIFLTITENKKHWRTMISTDPYLREVFPAPPLIAYKVGRSLGSQLIRARIPRPAPLGPGTSKHTAQTRISQHAGYIRNKNLSQQGNTSTQGATAWQTWALWSWRELWVMMSYWEKKGKATTSAHSTPNTREWIRKLNCRANCF